MFQKILIANRGEIACRVIKTARENGIRAVAVYSDADRGARHVRLADEAYYIGGSAAQDSYLLGHVIIDAALKSGAEAIHPGYGFLSENAAFVEACTKAGLIFIGPSAHSMRSMGLKDKAKEIMAAAHVPVLPGYLGEDQNPMTLHRHGDDMGYPLLIKAVAGGGGKGMRLVTVSGDFMVMLETCKREAMASFGNDHVLLEKYLSCPRHIEVQIFGDNYGNVVHLYERDCSLQRRHQKLIEEAPAPGLSGAMRKAMGDAAVKAARAVNYSGAGTVEFIVDGAKGIENAAFYFMEMNTRLQVEHPVTECITGQDLVDWQIRIAAGERLPLGQEDITRKGHGFELRLYAEDPENNFMPQTGKITHFSYPENMHGLRMDTAVTTGDAVSSFYDPMIAKLIVWGRDRNSALGQLRRALDQTALAGLKCNLDFLGAVIRRPEFQDGQIDTGFIDRFKDELVHKNRAADHPVLALAALFILNPDFKASDPWDLRDGWRMNIDLKIPLIIKDHDKKREIQVTYGKEALFLSIDGQGYDARIVGHSDCDIVLLINGEKHAAKIILESQNVTVFYRGTVSYLYHHIAGIHEEDGLGGGGVITTPMPGRVVHIMVAHGDIVTQGQPLVMIEAMKMEHTIKAQTPGRVDAFSLKIGDQVAEGAVLIRIIEDPIEKRKRGDE